MYGIISQACCKALKTDTKQLPICFDFIKIEVGLLLMIGWNLAQD